MCICCKQTIAETFCDSCLLTLEQFDISYRTGVKLATLDGVKKLRKEGR
jgi:hypothetical protein